MMRLDLLGRVLLILLGAILLLGATSVTLLLLHEQAQAPPPATFPRVRQVAGVIDLVSQADASQRDTILRAATGVDMTARILPSMPRTGDPRRAPRLEAQLRRFMTTSAPVAAYVSPRFKPRKTAGRMEGFLARAVARLPDGRFVSLVTNSGPDEERPRLFDLPASLWMGAVAAVVALLALLLTAREMRPLRQLARAAHRFDDMGVTVQPSTAGASDIRRTAAAVADMQARVIDLLGERSLMIGAISHDLRTLLTRMRLRTASLGEGALRDGYERDLDGMDAMLADALAFARGTSATVRTPLDLADVAAAEIAEREVRPGKAMIAAHLHDAPCVGDAHARQRVIANLLDNAEKYGRRRVCVSVFADRDRVSLTVEDDGPGIAPEQWSAVLAPYHRGDDPQRRRLAGSGLGLAIVQQIVRAHGGAVMISDSALGGAMMVVKLSRRE